MGNVSLVCFFASYLVAFAAEWLRLKRGRSLSRYVALLFALAGFVAHNFYLLDRSRIAELPPLLSSTHDWLLVLAWLAVILYLFLGVADRDLAAGLFLLPLVLVLTIAAHFVSQRPNAVVERDIVFRWAMLHATLLVFGISAVLVGIVLSMMYLVQHRRLKHKQSMREGLRLPSLALLARLNRCAILVSVPLLTVGMLTGVLLMFLSRSDPDPITFSDPLVIGSAFIWLAMAVLAGWILTRRRPAGKQMAWRTIWAAGFALITLLGLDVLAGGHESSRAQSDTRAAPAVVPAELPRVSLE